MAPRKKSDITLSQLPKTARIVFPADKYPCAGRSAEDVFDTTVPVHYYTTYPAVISDAYKVQYAERYRAILFTFLDTLNTEQLLQNVFALLVGLASVDDAYCEDISSREESAQYWLARNLADIVVDVYSITFFGTDFNQVYAEIERRPEIWKQVEAAQTTLLEGWDAINDRSGTTQDHFTRLAAECRILVGNYTVIERFNLDPNVSTTKN